MKLDFPKVVHTLYLKDYQPQFGEQSIDVWVNPLPEQSASIAKSLMRDTQEEDRKAGFTALVEIWSQGDDESRHWTVDGLEKFVVDCTEKDPMLFLWMVTQTMQMLIDYRTNLKKNSLRV